MSQALTDPIGYLFGLEQYGIKLGLDNIRALSDGLGHPERAFTSVLVAGTNGKGSVAAMLDTALRAAGYATGRFTSPHLVNLAERFAIDGQPVAPAALEDEAEQLRKTVCRLVRTGRLAAPPTFFEATTAIALSLFRRAGTRIAVLEVGMGGRFDATNVVTPVAVAIPSIDLDHQQFLGSTLEEIALEKAGVIRAGTLGVTAETKSLPLRTLRRVSDERGARLIEVDREVEARATVRDGVTCVDALITPHRQYGPLTLALRGRHQVRNAMTAVRLLEELGTVGVPVPASAIRESLVTTAWRGRLELVELDPRRRVLLDAAHNVAAASALADYLAEAFPSGLPLVFAALRDKDVAGMLRALGASVTRIICAPLTSSRAWPVDQLASLARAVRPDVPVGVAKSPAAAVEEAWGNSTTVCAAGSVYLVGELIRTLVPG